MCSNPIAGTKKKRVSLFGWPTPNRLIAALFGRLCIDHQHRGGWFIIVQHPGRIIPMLSVTKRHNFQFWLQRWRVESSRVWNTIEQQRSNKSRRPLKRSKLREFLFFFCQYIFHLAASLLSLQVSKMFRLWRTCQRMLPFESHGVLLIVNSRLFCSPCPS